GKTRLLAEFARGADTRGRLVLVGSASELERDLPFSVFVDALDEYLRALDPSRLARLDEDVRTELAHVFPSLSALATAREVALQRIELAALTPFEARELLGEQVAVADATVLYDESGGNPFYLEQLARSLGREGAATAAPELSLGGIGVPAAAAVAASLSEELG